MANGVIMAFQKFYSEASDLNPKVGQLVRNSHGEAKAKYEAAEACTDASSLSQQIKESRVLIATYEEQLGIERNRIFILQNTLDHLHNDKAVLKGIIQICNEDQSRRTMALINGL